MTRVAYTLLILALFGVGCNKTYIPKPRGHFRIDFPEKAYHSVETDCPFEFEIPNYSRFQLRPEHAEQCWFNIDFPKNKAKIHFTYKEVNGNLRQLLDESHHLSYEHHVKANDITTSRVAVDSTCTYGLVYHLTGDVASHLQFYLTDSTNHFIRGSLYFNTVVNSDSIAPVVDFIAEDVNHLIATMKWRNSACR